MPTVSVLIRTYNAQKTVASALDSLRRQTYGDWECILCDDGSSDATADVVRDFARTDARFVLVQEAHRGIVSALNQGTAHCQGRFVARFDADDIMHRERLAVQVGFLERNPQLAGVGCQVRIFPRRNLTDGRRAYETWLNGLVDESMIYRDRFV